MFTLPQPASDELVQLGNATDAMPPIDLPEDSATVSGLLRLIYPIPVPSFEDLDALAKVLFAADKYDMQGALSTLRHFLLNPRYLNRDPVHVYALVRRFGWKEEAHVASRLTLTLDVHDSKYLPMFTATETSAADLFTLFAARHKRIEGMRSYLDGEDFEGNSAEYECQACGKALNDTSWPLLKAAILKEMYRRPLGDHIFGAEFFKSTAMGAFVEGKCVGCGVRCYHKGVTFGMIKAHLDTLPDCACESCPFDD